jgi:hypothetical protein
MAVRTLTDRHREILRAIGSTGANELTLGAAARSREFDDLTHFGLVVFWHPLGTGPRTSVLGGAPGSWCLTFAGAEAAGLPELRFA